MTSSIVNQYGQPFTFAHGADRSNRRGPQYAVRNDDIDKLIPSHDRMTLASLSNRLFMNMGVPKACVLQKADYSVGEAWLPTYLGADKEAGEIAAKFMHDVFLPQCDVRGGVFDWWKALELSSVSMDVVGDAFIMLVKGDDGFPRIQAIPGHRCRSTNMRGIVEEGDYEGYRISDGIIYYRSGRPAAYRFDVGKNGRPEFKDIPASDIIHIFDPTHCEQGRGLPAFTHALESLKMSLFSTEDERVRQQIVSRLHLTVFNQTGGPDIDNPMGDDNECAPGAFTTQAFPGGVMYMPSEGNERVEQIKHENPGPVWESFQDRIVRDAVVSVWSYNVWKGGGQGTEARGEIIKCRRFITKRQGQLWFAARRIMAWAYSIFAEQGRVPQLKSPTLWDFSRPPRLSVDDGRESKMESDELKLGSRNLSEILESRGLREDDFYTQRARSVWMRKFIAEREAEELNKKFGKEITIEDREMFMQSPNETAESKEEDIPQKNEDEE